MERQLLESCSPQFFVLALRTAETEGRFLFYWHRATGAPRQPRTADDQRGWMDGGPTWSAASKQGSARAGWPRRAPPRACAALSIPSAYGGRHPEGEPACALDPCRRRMSGSVKRC